MYFYGRCRAVIESAPEVTIKEMQQNILYLATLPLFHLGPGIPRAEEVFTLYPDRDFATQFFPDELNRYKDTFKFLVQQLKGGHVIGYDFIEEDAGNGRIILQVIQNVS